MSETMRERLKAFCFAHECWTTEDEEAICAFAEAKVRAALSPREQSPELAEAEKWLRAGGFSPPKMSQVIVGEIDRLRAENVRLKEPPAPLDDATMAELVLVCPKGAKELAHLRRENARLSAEVEGLLSLCSDSAVKVYNLAFSMRDHMRQTLCAPTDAISEYIADGERTALLLREASRNAEAAQPAPAQDGDRATREFWIDSRSAVVAIEHAKEGCSLYEREQAENNAFGMANVRVYRITITAERAKETG